MTKPALHSQLGDSRGRIPWPGYKITHHFAKPRVLHWKPPEHLCTSLVNKYTAACYVQFSSKKPKTLTFSNLRQPVSCSSYFTAGPGTWGKTPNILLHFCLCKQGTEGTTPASSSKGIGTDKAADFQSQKAALPKFPSWSLPTSKHRFWSLQKPRSPAPRCFVSCEGSPSPPRRSRGAPVSRSITPSCLHEYEALHLKTPKRPKPKTQHPRTFSCHTTLFSSQTMRPRRAGGGWWLK